MLATRTRLRWWFGGSFTLGAIAVAALGQRAAAGPSVTPAAIELAVPAEPAVPVRVVAAEDAAPAPRPQPALAFGFVIETVDRGVYMKLADGTGIAHGKVRVIHEPDGIEWNGIAQVAPRAVPARLRDALGAQVAIGACVGTLDGFAVVARASGDGDWDAARLFREGEAQDLVAHVRGGECLSKLPAHGAFARDVALAPAAVGVQVALDPDTAARVKADLYATDAARTQAESYADPGYGDEAYPPWREAVAVSKIAYVHPLTHERWIAIRAFTGGGCGERTFDLAGLYRQSGTGALTRVWVGKDEQIEQLVDVDNDGTFDMITAPSEFDVASQLLDATGAEHQVVRVPYYGCPC